MKCIQKLSKSLYHYYRNYKLRKRLQALHQYARDGDHKHLIGHLKWYPNDYKVRCHQYNYNTLFHTAMMSHKLDMLKALRCSTKHFLNIDRYGNNMLHYLAWYPNIEVFKSLLAILNEIKSPLAPRATNGVIDTHEINANLTDSPGKIRNSSQGVTIEVKEDSTPLTRSNDAISGLPLTMAGNTLVVAIVSQFCSTGDCCSRHCHGFSFVSCFTIVTVLMYSRLAAKITTAHNVGLPEIRSTMG
jgi:hypothetical protein